MMAAAWLLLASCLAVLVLARPASSDPYSCDGAKVELDHRRALLQDGEGAGEAPTHPHFPLHGGGHGSAFKLYYKSSCVGVSGCKLLVRVLGMAEFGSAQLPAPAVPSDSASAWGSLRRMVEGGGWGTGRRRARVCGVLEVCVCLLLLAGQAMWVPGWH